MKRRPVNSSCIASIGYDPRRRELEIEFLQDGEVYRYFDVPLEEHAAFMAAESKGIYLNEVLKPRSYRCDIVRQEKRL
jgi:KTSC domain